MSKNLKHLCIITPISATLSAYPLDSLIIIFTGIFIAKNRDKDNVQVRFTSDNINVKSLGKKVDDLLLDTAPDTKAHDQPAGLRQNEQKGVPQQGSQSKVSVPEWIADSVNLIGKKVSTVDYGDVILASNSNSTVVVVGNKYEVKFRSDFSSRIKENYQTDKVVYFVLNSEK